MELKLLLVETVKASIACSNRTFMELKYDRAEGNEVVLLVLIVPLWN